MLLPQVSPAKLCDSRGYCSITAIPITTQGSSFNVISNPRALANLSYTPNLKSLASAVAEILKMNSRSPGSCPFFRVIFYDGSWQDLAACYGNINIFIKFRSSQNWETPYCFDKLTLPLDSQPPCFLCNVLWSCNCRKWATFAKIPFYNKKWKTLGAGLKTFGIKCDKAHLYPKTGRIYCFPYVPLALF